MKQAPLTLQEKIALFGIAAIALIPVIEIIIKGISQ